MRITTIHVQKWRNFRDIKIEVPEETKMVCLVGENGTGKSNILELISAASNQFGIVPGTDIPRGSPFNEEHEFLLRIKISEPISELLQDIEPELDQASKSWTGYLTLKSKKNGDAKNQIRIFAEGIIDEAKSITLARKIKQSLDARKETNYLVLDANRSYPYQSLSSHDLVQALEQDWSAPQSRRHRAFMQTRTMYDEWIKYFLSVETKEAAKLLQEHRRCQESGERLPQFVDLFKPYKESVLKVLPHLKFIGVDTEKKSILFDSAGMKLNFSNLSGGEKEIAFILGQIERFQLRRGLLLIDEPELHLNPDLLRNWVAYLKDTVVDGQIWIGTHSLEAVEAAGSESTIVLERKKDSRIVERCMLLSDRPVLAVLSAAVGSPAFAISNLKFVYVEGDKQGREKEKYFKLYGDSRFVRFIEGGGCAEVLKKLSITQELAEESKEPIKLGAVIDRDFKNKNQVDEIESEVPILILRCHEVENLYLHPDTLDKIMELCGANGEARDVIQEYSDRFAGMWVLGHMIAQNHDINFDPKKFKKNASQVTWNEIHGDMDNALEKILQLEPGLSDEQKQIYKERLVTSVDVYRELREGNELWKYCMGKQVLSAISSKLGLKSASILENHAHKIWEGGNVPEEILDLRRYISSI